MANASGDAIPEALMDKLRATARARTVTHYSDVAPLLGIDIGDEYFGVRVGHVLDAVNRQEFDAGRPLLSAVVVSKDTSRPGTGYYGCAKALRRYSDKSDEEAWYRELQRVHDYWSTH